MRGPFRRTFVLLAVTAGLLSPARVYAEEKEEGRTGTWLKTAIVTDEKFSRDEKTVFAPDAPAIYAIYRVVAAGPAKLKAVFWADAVEGLDPKTKLLEKVMTVNEKGEFMGAVPALKPVNGWPVGSYRVEFYVGEALSKSVSFKVVKKAGTP
ncbi:MAG: hypothetical protein ABI768_14850 [Acidobacteriota bacterium]